MTLPVAEDQLALRPPPAPDPAVLAEKSAEKPIEKPNGEAADEYDPVHEPWRFSGRWWNKPVPLRRDRPWARR